MGETTKIQWCDHTFNPWIGCAKVSPGCAHCYAAVDTFARTRRAQGRELWGKDADRHRTSEANWKQPLRWNRDAHGDGVRRRVFCASQSDIFEDRADLIRWRADLFSLICQTPQLDWLVLSKRPESWRKVMRDIIDLIPHQWWAVDWVHGIAPANIWVGTSVEDQQRADDRIPHLLEIPARVRWLSVEPLLGPVDLTPWLEPVWSADANPDASGSTCPAVDWVIVGGESGTSARPCDIAWVRAIIKQCKAADVPVFVKQVGANVACPNDRVADWFGSCGHLSLTPTERYQGAIGHVIGFRDHKGGDPAEWIEDLRVREWPKLTEGGKR